HEGFGNYYISISSFVLFATFVVNVTLCVLCAAQVPSHSHRTILRSIPLLLQPPVDFFRRQRQVKDADTRGIGDGIGNRRRRGNVGVLGNLLAAERRRPRRGFDQNGFEGRHVADARQLRFAEGEGGNLAIDHRVFFHQRKSQTGDDAAIDLSGQGQAI